MLDAYLKSSQLTGGDTLTTLTIPGWVPVHVTPERDEVVALLKPGEWVEIPSDYSDVWINPATVAMVLSDRQFSETHVGPPDPEDAVPGPEVLAKLRPYRGMPTTILCAGTPAAM